MFSYLDFRKFLSDLFNHLKKTKNITLRLFSRKAGFSSHAFLKQIIDGTRSVSVSSVYKISKGFGLSSKESDYLELLVRFNQAEDIDEKNEIYKKLAKFIPKEKITKIDKEHYKLFSNWYIMAIREMVTMSTFREDFHWISKTLVPNITKKEAKEAIALLLQLKFLKRDENGKLIQTTPVLTTGPEVKSLFITNYHRNLLQLSALSMQSTDKEWRDISSLAFILDRDEFKFIKRRVVEFRAEILQYLKDKRNNFPESKINTDSQLYYLNMQLFNATKLNWKNSQKKE